MADPVTIWTGFPWEAAATLTTGVLAVVAAGWVGWRQAGIADRQTTILDRQTELEEAKLRVDLFDRRMKVFEATDAYIGATIGNMDQGYWTAANKDFIKALDQSRFLFSKDVHDQLQMIRAKGRTLRSRHAVQDQTEEQNRKLEQRSEELRMIRLRLFDVFGAEMSLEGKRFVKSAGDIADRA